jgi:ribosomal-protein-alanine N-acetyltransferase
MTVLETERLLFREMTPDDAAHAYELNNDPEVLRYTGDEPFDSIKEASDFLSNYAHYRQYGYGRWAVVRKSDHAWIGWCGLKCHPEENEFDIGFRLLRKYWNQGYATEAAAACIKIGFDQYNMHSIIGRAMPENEASIRVLEKLGMAFEDFVFEDNIKWAQYRVRP